MVDGIVGVSTIENRIRFFNFKIQWSAAAATKKKNPPLLCLLKILVALAVDKGKV